MSFTKLGVVLPLEAPGEVSAFYVRHPSLLVKDDRVYMYYTRLPDAAHVGIALAVSDDGLRFTELGIVLPLGEAGQFDNVIVYAGSSVALGGRVFHYYTGSDGSKHRVGLAISNDGINFTKLGVVLCPGETGDYDDRGATFSSALIRDGRVYLYYAALNSNYQIALAISDNGINFTKLGTVIPQTLGAFDGSLLTHPCAIERDGVIYLFYTGKGGSPARNRIGLAISSDGVQFVKTGVVVPVGTGSQFDADGAEKPGLVELDGRLLLYYTGVYGVGRIGLAISEDGL